MAIVTEDKPDREYIGNWIQRCGAYSSEQVGIELYPSLFVQANLPPVNHREERLTEIHKILRDHTDWDIAVNPASYSAGDALAYISLLPLPVTLAYIDDTYRRYIVVKPGDCKVFLHEFFHAFILSNLHSDSGLMSSSGVALLPFTPLVNVTEYLSPQDREEVLKNKWRDFNNRVEVEGPDRLSE